MRPITGARYAGRKRVSSAARWPTLFAAYQCDSHSTIASENSSGARDSASTPPASTRFERPARMLLIAESSACMPDAQLRITVQPGTFSPQPMRSAATRPMFTSSGEGAAQPRITSSNSGGLERLAQQQRAARVGREIRRGERARPVPRLEERRARAVDDVDRLVVHRGLANRFSDRVSGDQRAAAAFRARCGAIVAASCDRHRATGVAAATCRDPARNRRRGSRARSARARRASRPLPLR